MRNHGIFSFSKLDQRLHEAVNHGQSELAVSLAGHLDLHAEANDNVLEFPPYLFPTVPFSVVEVIVDEINASQA